MFSLLIFMALKQIDLIMVEIFDKHEASVGYFSAASQSAQILIITYTSLNLLFSPFISEAMQEGAAKLKNILWQMARITSLFCLPMLLILIVFGKEILGLFGGDYVVAYPALVTLALGLSINAILGSHITFLQFSNKPFTVVIVQCFTLAINLTLNAILIPLYSITGAGIASATALIVMTLWIRYLSWRKLQEMQAKDALANEVKQ